MKYIDFLSAFSSARLFFKYTKDSEEREKLFLVRYTTRRWQYINRKHEMKRNNNH